MYRKWAGSNSEEGVSPNKLYSVGYKIRKRLKTAPASIKRYFNSKGIFFSGNVMKTRNVKTFASKKLLLCFIFIYLENEKMDTKVRLCFLSLVATRWLRKTFTFRSHIQYFMYHADYRIVAQTSIE